MSTAPLSPSAATPTSLPSERTQVAPYSWLRRHMGAVAAVAPVLSAAVSWGVGLLGGMDPVKAFGQLGAPMGFVVLLVMALVWTFTVHIPRQAEQAEKTRQAQLTDAAEDRALFRDTMHEVSNGLKDVAARLGTVEQTLVRIDKRGPDQCRHQAICGATEEDRTPPATPSALSLPRET